LAKTRAEAKGIVILRAYDRGAVRADGSGPRQGRTIFTIDLTSVGEFQIQPGDLIHVTESSLLPSRNVLTLIGSAWPFRPAVLGIRAPISAQSLKCGAPDIPLQPAAIVGG
jgi:polysaccharide export outer membrane protein